MIYRVYTSYSWRAWECSLPLMEQRLKDVWFEKWSDRASDGVVVVIRVDSRRAFHLRLQDGTDLVQLVLVHLSNLTIEINSEISNWHTRVIRVEAHEEADACPT